MQAFDTTFAHRLAKLNLAEVIAHMQAETGMDDATATKAEALYRQFLTLVAKNPGTPVVPPVLADHVWDAHVKFTRRYGADCELLFGEFLHHNPHAVPQTAGYEAFTIPAFQKEFGVDLAAASQLNPANFAAASCHA